MQQIQLELLYLLVDIRSKAKSQHQLQCMNFNLIARALRPAKEFSLVSQSLYIRGPCTLSFIKGGGNREQINPCTNREDFHLSGCSLTFTVWPASVM